MRNPNHTYLELANDLDQHLMQAEAVISYLGMDLGENKDFTVSLDIVSGMLWTAETLIENAKKTAKALHDHHRQEAAFEQGTGQKIAQIEAHRLAQTTKGGDDE